MTIDILISTISSNISNVPFVLLKQREDVSYIISIQVINNVAYEIPDVLKQRKDVSIFFCKEKGLSMNRNNCIKHATSDICIIADDDVKYKNSYIDKIKNEFIKDSSLDILIGKIKTNIGEKEYKNYKQKVQKITFLNFKNISSIEIGFRRRSIINSDLVFDKNFGLGSTKFSKGGEESIFIRDAILKKMKIFYYPFYIVNHPYESSGKTTDFNQQYMVFLGGYSRRVSGVFGYLLFVYFLYKHRRRLKTFKKVTMFFSFFYKGFNM